MNDIFTRRVSAAAGAAWWVILIAVGWLTVAWIIWLLILSAKPQWILSLWGGDITWEQVHSMVIIFVGAFKLIFFAGFLTTIWLTIWSHKLNRLAD